MHLELMKKSQINLTCWITSNYAEYIGGRSEPMPSLKIDNALKVCIDWVDVFTMDLPNYLYPDHRDLNL
jgi:hypothetical protein